MKKLLALVLALSMLLSLLTGCGGQAGSSQSAPATETTAAATEPATEPTLSPEEMLYNSLPARMQQAVDAGLVELFQLEDLKRIVTVGEASQMLQKAYIHRTGVESKMLNELMNTPEYANETATLIWIAGVPGLADMELSHGEHYENYGQWRTHLNKETQGMEDLRWSFSWRLAMTAVAPGIAEPRTAFQYDENGDSYFSQYGIFFDTEISWPDTPLYAYEVVDPSPYDYGRSVYDSTNGKKYVTLENDMDWLREMTIVEVAECALVYCNFPNPMAYPTFVAPEEVGSFNSDIITADLLEKGTDLPTPSCQNLPKQWHGTVMDDMTIFERNLHLDDQVYEYEIQKVKEAGFNFIGLNLDFSWLQDNLLTDGQKDPYVGFVKSEDAGKLSLERLEQLDRVLALCMKYDIHLNLRATSMGGYNNENRNNQRNDITSEQSAAKLAAMWQAIARRYADIPNEYLSFTLFTSVSNIDATAKTLLPSVESIRQVSPDRCIIADIYGWKMQAADVTTLAEAGVALSSRIRNPEEVFLHRDHYQYDGVRMNFTAAGISFVQNFDWPYQGKTDAKALLAMEQGRLTPEAVMAVAQEYGVGYMLSDFGVTFDQFQVGSDNMVYPRCRFSDEAYFAMIRDITSTMEELGYGWCFAHWYGPYGVAFCIPVIQTSTYKQVEDYPYYIDQGMLSLFQELNAA